MKTPYIFLSFFQDITNGPGEGTYADHTWEIIIMLLVAFILGYLLRYFIGRKWIVLAKDRQETILKLEGDLAACRKRSNELEESLASVRYDLEKANDKVLNYQSRNADLDIQLKACKEQLGNSTNTKGAAVVMGSVSSSDDDRIDYNKAFDNSMLQIIEGIGPKIERILKENGIGNWSALASTSADRLASIINDNKLNFAKPDTWPKQAKMAVEGKWAELIQFQKDYNPNTDSLGEETDAKAEKMAARLLGITLYESDDLKVVEGVGPKIEQLLKAGGINNWAELARASVDHLQAILDKAGDDYNMAAPETWPKQAQLAADGKWKELDKYQEFLEGGKNPK